MLKGAFFHTLHKVFLTNMHMVYNTSFHQEVSRLTGIHWSPFDNYTDSRKVRMAKHWLLHSSYSRTCYMLTTTYEMKSFRIHTSNLMRKFRLM